MEELLNHTAPRIALIASGIFFMTGLLTGAWKYLCMRRHPNAEAPHYVNTAHRAALMYAFAAQLLAVFAATSAFSDTVNTVAVIFPLLFFGIAIFHYINLGLTTQSNNSLRDSANRAKDNLMLNILAVSEIGGFSVLLVGFFLRIWG
ncbi:MAG: hypothetical protein PHD39_10650 [Methylobacter tundripaludum]|uniref:Uncharacterized protein n=1 Tax=Methylobacter tundripaludum TaxID=173365 RepID=A0A2S6HE74_9GAMM|nr:hypothetical protein [Methylobacter tundripaludum]MDD4906605.1 hypothetical protein [Methylobacter tundripaludum]PPK75768.1 hypothetical protein B0F87_105240 [Methylobacter tundripaludum]